MKFQFVLGSGLSSRLIAWYGQGYGGWSHVDAILSDGTCLGARSDVIYYDGKRYESGVQIRPPGYETWKRRTVMTLATSSAVDVAWESFLRTQIGKQYDKANIASFILGLELYTQGEWICSALHLDALEVVGAIPHLHVTPQQCPPNMLFSIINAVGGIPS